MKTIIPVYIGLKPFNAEQPLQCVALFHAIRDAHDDRKVAYPVDALHVAQAVTEPDGVAQFGLTKDADEDDAVQPALLHGCVPNPIS